VPKKRQTRQQKIILQLKRELAKKQVQSTPESTRQEAILPSPKPEFRSEKNQKLKAKKTADSNLLFNASLIKKDLLKTLILTLGILSLEIVLYLRLK